MGELFSTRAADATEKLVGEWRRGKFNRPPQLKPPESALRPAICGILLSDLYNDQSADCAVLAEAQDPSVQKISLLGQINGIAGTITATFGNQTTAPLPWNVAPDVLKAALEKLSGIGVGNLTVTLGNQTYRNAFTGSNNADFPGVWIVRFTGAKFRNSTTIPLITVASTITGGLNLVTNASTTLIDTGDVVTVKGPIPTGLPTPTRAGATVIAVQCGGIGYCVAACEPRQFATYY
jgi:hypothetical protein